MISYYMYVRNGTGWTRSSSTGFGNFEEIGPYDVYLNPRNTTWVQAANVLFVDNPVGTGYSYVDEESAYTTNVDEIAQDLLTLFEAFLQANTVLRYIHATESVYTCTLFAWSEAAATISFTAKVCVATIWEWRLTKIGVCLLLSRPRHSYNIIVHAVEMWANSQSCDYASTEPPRSIKTSFQRVQNTGRQRETT